MSLWNRGGRWPPKTWEPLVSSVTNRQQLHGGNGNVLCACSEALAAASAELSRAGRTHRKCSFPSSLNLPCPFSATPRPADRGAEGRPEAHPSVRRGPAADAGHLAEQQHPRGADPIHGDCGQAPGVPRGHLLDRPLLQRPAHHRPGSVVRSPELL